MKFTIKPLSFVGIVVGPRVKSIYLSFIVDPTSIVLIPVSPRLLTKAISFAVYPLSIVNTTVCPSHFSRSVFEAVLRWTNINTFFINNFLVHYFSLTYNRINHDVWRWTHSWIIDGIFKLHFKNLIYFLLLVAHEFICVDLNFQKYLEGCRLNILVCVRNFVLNVSTPEITKKGFTHVLELSLQPFFCSFEWTLNSVV